MESSTYQTILKPGIASPETSLRAAYSKHILHKHLLGKLNDARKENYDVLPRAPVLPDHLKDDSPYEGRICIIGAGATGLYIAMMLKWVGITNVDILEANDRVGGRLYTHNFSDDNDNHDYYDVGAMRIPWMQWMKS